MSYQVLARKWRPSNFSEVAGQAHVLKALINALDNERLHHAYLFCGTRGVGKTTLARVLAKCLNCETGVTSDPCGQCNSCLAIKEGRFLDLIEVDAASRTKVEDTRELLENVQYSPSAGRFKVYLIDEVHMLSNHSFNALLKTLEEPPPHVKFLFATTEPKKLPVTILSRCLQFNLKPLAPKVIVDALAKILEKEKFAHDAESLWDIAAAADGSMRDALTLLDQGISFCEGQIRVDDIREMLGVPDKQQSFNILEAIAAKSASNALEIIEKIAETSPDFVSLLDNLLSTFHRLAIAKILPNSIDNDLGDKEQVLKLSEQFLSEDLQLYYQMGAKARSDLQSSQDYRSAFEMLILRMIVFSPIEETNASRETVANQKKKLKQTQSSNHVSQNESQASREAQELKEPSLTDAGIAYPHRNSTAGPKSQQTLRSQNAVVLDTNKEWLSVYSKLNLNGLLENVLSNAELIKRLGKDYYFKLDENVATVYNKEMLPKLSSILSSFLGFEVSVHVDMCSKVHDTPSKVSRRLKKEARDDLVKSFEQDSNVQKVLSHFSGKISTDSVLPLKE